MQYNIEIIKDIRGPNYLELTFTLVEIEDDMPYRYINKVWLDNSNDVFYPEIYNLLLF